MDLKDKFPAKVSGVRSLSSSVQSTPEKNGNSDDASRSPELIPEFLKYGPKKEPLQAFFDKDKKQSLATSKSKGTELVKASSKTEKKQEPKKASSSLNEQTPKKQSRKGENPTRLENAAEQSQDIVSSRFWICKNSACRAVLSLNDAFCKRCSCCMCHSFDDNKDPSLWLVCTSDNERVDSCGLSCHIECALQNQKVGVADLGQFMQLDGSYCCASCGKVSGILECWMKQLVIAKDARRLDILCYRIYLSYRLLDGTSRFKELHDFIKEAKAKLETEVGPVDGVSAKMARGIVSRLSIAGDVQRLCTLAIEKADNWVSAVSKVNAGSREDSLAAACKFLFEEVTSSSVTIILVEPSSISLSVKIKGYKLWYCKSKGERHSKEPISVFSRSQRRISISNLQPCTEYTFRVVSYTDSGDFGHSEAKCFTKSKEISFKNSNTYVAISADKEANACGGNKSSSKSEFEATLPSGFKVQELGKVLHFPWAQGQGCSDGFCCADTGNCCGGSNIVKPETKQEQSPPVSRELDLNIASVPDLNEELTPPFDSSRDEDIECTPERVVGADDDAASHEIGKNGLARSSNTTEEMPAVDSRAELCRKRSSNAAEEMQDCDSTLINGSSFQISNSSGSLDENFEYCVKIIRWLECRGHIDQEFRLKLLTWFSLRSTEQERLVVNTFIQALIDDPSSLAGQLVDSFTDIISSNKRQRNGFCSKLWH